MRTGNERWRWWGSMRSGCRPKAGAGGADRDHGARAVSPAGAVMIVAASHSHSSGPLGMIQPGDFDGASDFVKSLAYNKSSMAGCRLRGQSAPHAVVEAVVQAADASSGGGDGELRRGGGADGGLQSPGADEKRAGISRIRARGTRTMSTLPGRSIRRGGGDRLLDAGGEAGRISVVNLRPATRRRMGPGSRRTGSTIWSRPFRVFIREQMWSF